MSKLALFGGKPVRTNPFPVWPRVTDTIKTSIIESYLNDTWGVGSKSNRIFQDNFAKYHDSKYCITTNSGTSAIWVALKAAGVKAGDEVIIPSYTFIATASAILMANAIPVFVDVDPDTFNMDSTQIEKVITSKTRVIMPVHIAGNPADMDAILSTSEKHNLLVIEDAAQAHGAEWNHKKIGALGLGGIFSFQTSKNMSSGEGGAIVTNNEEFADACFSYHNCGRVKGGKWYEHQHLGGNYRLNAIAASMLTEQLKTLDDDNQIRTNNRKILDSALSDIAGLSACQSYSGNTQSANHLYLAKYNKNEFNQIPRESFFKAMQAEGVYTYGGYVPLYKEKLFIINPDEYPWLKNRDYSALHMPVTERLCYQEAVWLKQNHLLGTGQDTQDIIDAFEKVTTEMKNNPNLFNK